MTLPPLLWVTTISRVMPRLFMNVVSWPARQPAAPLVHMYWVKSQLMTT